MSISYAQLTVDQIDRLREEGLKDWAAAGGSLNEVHRYLARAVERHVVAQFQAGSAVVPPVKERRRFEERG